MLTKLLHILSGKRFLNIILNMLNTKLSRILSINIGVVLSSLVLLAVYSAVVAFFGCNAMREIDPPFHVTCFEESSFWSSIVLFILILFVNFTSIRNSKSKQEYFINSSPQIILLVLLYLSLKSWI